MESGVAKYSVTVNRVFDIVDIAIAVVADTGYGFSKFRAMPLQCGTMPHLYSAIQCHTSTDAVQCHTSIVRYSAIPLRCGTVPYLYSAVQCHTSTVRYNAILEQCGTVPYLYSALHCHTPTVRCGTVPTSTVRYIAHLYCAVGGYLFSQYFLTDGAPQLRNLPNTNHCNPISSTVQDTK